MKSDENKNITVIDLFAGAGGFSEGFLRNGFDIIAYIEKDKYAADTLFTRHIYWELKKSNKEERYYDYLNNIIDKKEFYSFARFNPVINKEISQDTIAHLIKNIQQNMTLKKVNHIDVFIGGPPCQAYSLVGRARDPYEMKRDPRAQLYQFYVAILKKFKPLIFVFENVPGLLSANNGKLWKDVQNSFSNAGYTIEARTLDSSDFMVLQKRKRIILIGWQKRYKLNYPSFETIKHPYKVKDILTDLPALAPGDVMEIGKYKRKPPEYLITTGIRTEKDILIQHSTRPLNNIDREIYRIAIEMWKKHKKRIKYTDLPQELKTHNNEHCFLDRFKVVADDLPYSHTLVAHIAKDGHYYIHPDIKQLRSISVREAARIQSFPDNYKFEGPRTAQFMQIGNAVPPLMAEKIAEKIKEMILWIKE